jgi:hypothetical protein
MPWVLDQLWKEIPGAPRIGSWVDPRVSLGKGEETTNLLPLHGIQPRFLGLLAHSLSLYR